MKNIIFLTFLLLSGCNSQSSEDKSESIIKDTSSALEKDVKLPLIISGCYAYIAKKDSALLNLNISGNNISGKLNYSLYEKDGNRGTINGSIQESLVIADYTFQSEGMTSVRQVVFKIHGDSLIEGFGDTDVKGDTAKFKNISLLQFQNGRAFIKTNCK